MHSPVGRAGTTRGGDRTRRRMEGRRLVSRPSCVSVHDTLLHSLSPTNIVLLMTARQPGVDSMRCVRSLTASGRRAVRTSSLRRCPLLACLGICSIKLLANLSTPPMSIVFTHLFSIELHTPETSRDDTRMASFARGRPC